MLTRISLPSSDLMGLWPEVAKRTCEWLESQQLSRRDAVVLVPSASMLSEARRAFALLTGWSPRIETTHTLAASLGPEAGAEPGQITFNPALDGLTAAQLLQAQSWGVEWNRGDPRGFEQAVTDVVLTAHSMAQAAASCPPDERWLYWERARKLLVPVIGPGARARLLARVALEWACLAPPLRTDRLFALSPSAWIVVQAGGADALAERLMLLAPGLMLDTNPPADEPLVHGLRAQGFHVAHAECSSFEDEAQCAATQTLLHLQREQYPVALIAQDRALVRRVRALLARQSVRLVDETGWKLSTTRAAAPVMTLLQVCQDGARIDTFFDWLLAATHWSVPTAYGAVAALEVTCRQRRVSRVSQLQRVNWVGDAALVWEQAGPILQDMTSPTVKPLQHWLAALAMALKRCGAHGRLTQDEAGRQVLAALRLQPPSTWTIRPDDFVMDLKGFTAWVAALLEQETYVPVADEAGSAQVVLTPLARVALRPFVAVVLAGADHRQWGARSAPHPLLSEAHRVALGVPSVEQRQADEMLALGHALRVPLITFFWRQFDGAEPLTVSPLLAQLALARQKKGLDWPIWHDGRPRHHLTKSPLHRSAPSTPHALLPQRLSASGYEALRACPYQFFALHLLRLREEDDLDAGVAKRDYGTFLHAVLHAFHGARGAPGSLEVEVAQLRAVAAAIQPAQGLDDADFLPFADTFNAFAPHYVEWLHQRDRQGFQWQQGELPRHISLPDVQGLELHGVLDRLDIARGSTLELIDYKTGSAAALKAKVALPLEDTQLAVYAALASAHHGGDLRAFYWAVDGVRGVQAIEHSEVRRSAATLLKGLQTDWVRMQEGAALPALGEGAVCQYCSARGVCRKDHWSAATTA